MQKNYVNNNKRIKNYIANCSYTECKRGELCPNFTEHYRKNSINFSSCMYNYAYLARKEEHGNK